MKSYSIPKKKLLTRLTLTQWRECQSRISLSTSSFTAMPLVIRHCQPTQDVPPPKPPQNKSWLKRGAVCRPSPTATVVNALPVPLLPFEPRPVNAPRSTSIHPASHHEHWQPSIRASYRLPLAPVFGKTSQLPRLATGRAAVIRIECSADTSLRPFP